MDDGYVEPKTKMLMAVACDDIPDELSPDEIWALVNLVLEERLGRGEARKRILGKWYRIIQSLVNRMEELKKRRVW